MTVVVDNYLLNKQSLTMFLVLIFIQTMQGALAAEYDVNEKPIKEIIEEEGSDYKSKLMEEPEEAVTKETAEEEVLPEQEPKKKKKVERPAGFFPGARVELKSRTAYFDRTNPGGIDQESFATGGSLMFHSGKWKDFFTVHTEVFTSQKLYGDIDRDGAQLLRDKQKEMTVLGTAYAQLDYKQARLRLGRQEFRMPYINRSDSRMIPHTYEAYAMAINQEKFEAIGGYVDKMKRRNSGSFVSMSKAAGVKGDSNEGMAMLGGRIAINKNTTFGMLNLYTFDVFNIFYSELNYSIPLRENNRLKFSAQFTDQRSVGDELLSTSPFQTQAWGVEGKYVTSDAIMLLAYSSVSERANIRHPYGGYPGYISLMKSFFNRAGEQAWMAELAYDFSKVGLEGVSMITKFASGYNAENVTAGIAIPDQQEFDITFDYYPPAGRMFSGLWFRVRGAKRWQDGLEDTHDIRVFLNYTYAIK